MAVIFGLDTEKTYTVDDFLAIFEQCVQDKSPVRALDFICIFDKVEGAEQRKAEFERIAFAGKRKSAGSNDTQVQEYERILEFLERPEPS